MTRVKDGNTGVFVNALFNDWAGAPVHIKARPFVDLLEKSTFLDASDVHNLAHVFTQAKDSCDEDEVQDFFADEPRMEDAISSYRSVRDAIAEYYLKVLPRKAQGWIAQAKLLLSRDSMGLYNSTTFLSSLKSNMHDLSERAPPREIDSRYMKPLTVIANFHNEFGRSMTERLGELGVSGALHMDDWFNAIRHMGDVVHDSCAVARDVELAFYYLRCFEDEQTLGDALELLSGEGFDRVDTLVSSMRKLSLIRAQYSGVAICVGWMPPLVIPNEFNTDLLRVMHALIHNGVQYRDMNYLENKKLERNVSITSSMDGSLLQLCVMDNGRGERDIQRHLAADRNGGLAVAARIAARNNWILEVDSKLEEGTRANIAIDTSAWSRTSDPADPGFRTTLPGPASATGGTTFLARGWTPGLAGASIMTGIGSIN